MNNARNSAPRRSSPRSMASTIRAMTRRQLLRARRRQAMNDDESEPSREVVASELGQLTLDALAARINEEHGASEQALHRSLQHALRAGALLIEAKGRVPHGQWLAWLKANTRVSERTAQLYMWLVRELPSYLAQHKGVTVTDLGMREVGALIRAGTPPETVIVTGPSPAPPPTMMVQVVLHPQPPQPTPPASPPTVIGEPAAGTSAPDAPTPTPPAPRRHRRARRRGARVHQGASGATMSPEEMRRWGLREIRPEHKEQALQRMRAINGRPIDANYLPPQSPKEPPTPEQEAEAKATAWAFATGDLGEIAPPPTDGAHYPELMIDLQHVLDAVIASRADTQKHLPLRGLTRPEWTYAARVKTTVAQWLVFMRELVLSQHDEHEEDRDGSEPQ